MRDFTDIDFNRANGYQRKALRVALGKVFRSDVALEQFLDEECDLRYDDLSPPGGTYSNRLYKLVQALADRGRLDDVMLCLSTNPEFSQAPALEDLRRTWDTLATDPGSVPQSIAPPQAEVPRLRTTSEVSGQPTHFAGLDRILDNEVAGSAARTWLGDLARLRSGVCLLRGSHSRATGFLIGPRHVMTAAYVLHYARNLSAVFDFDAGDADPGRAYKVKRVLVQEPASPDGDNAEWYSSLDYAVLELDAGPAGIPRPDGSDRPWHSIADTRHRLQTDEPLVMLHHAEGAGLRLAEGAMIAGHTDTRRLIHSCPTTGGSGGAPIFDTRLRLVGLHEGKISAPGLPPATNQAVRASHIARDLADKDMRFESCPF